LDFFMQSERDSFSRVLAEWTVGFVWTAVVSVGYGVGTWRDKGVPIFALDVARAGARVHPTNSPRLGKKLRTRTFPSYYQHIPLLQQHFLIGTKVCNILEDLSSLILVHCSWRA
jgi:hypothetical protein